MVNIYRATAPESIQETRLYPLLRRLMPELPDYALREAFQKRDVKMNGIRTGKDAIALPGAEIAVYSSYTAAPVLVDIVYADENVVIVVKPIGVSCEADPKGGRTIAELALAALKAREPEAEIALPRPCHRLDNQTDGLLVLARNDQAYAQLLEGFKHHKIHKRYTCLVKDTPQPQSALLEAYLLKNAEKAKVRIFPKPVPGALPIVTEYATLQRGEVSRLSVRLYTGRTHQIRAQMAYIGHPLLGDDVYGDRAFNKLHKAKRLMLCATELSFALEGSLSYLSQHTFTIQPLF